MVAKFAAYRKFFAALAVGLLGLAAQFAPGVSDMVPAGAIEVATVFAAAIAVALVENRAGGFNVADLAAIALKHLVENPQPLAAQAAADALADAKSRPRKSVRRAKAKPPAPPAARARQIVELGDFRRPRK